MKNNKQIMVAVRCLILVLMISGCKSKQEESVERTSEIEVNMNRLDDIYLSSLVSSVSLIPLDPKQPINYVDKLVVGKDHFFVLDNEQKGIFSYDRRGKLTGSLMRQGKGPQEYLRITDFILDEEKDVLFVYDNLSQKLLQYDLRLNFIGVQKVPFYADNIIKIPDGFIFYLPTGCYDAFCDKIIITDNDLSIKETMIPIQDNFESFSFGNTFNRIAAVNDTLIKFIDIDSRFFEIERTDGKYSATFGRPDFGELTTDPMFYQKDFSNGTEFLMDLLKQKTAVNLDNYLENNLFFHFAFTIDRKTYSYLLNKVSKEYSVHRKLQSKLLSIKPAALNERRFYNVLSPHLLIDEVLSAFDLKVLKENMINMENIDIEGNPIIVEYEIGDIPERG